MAQNENKKLHGRAELKKYFRNGQIPTETHFAYLIDSAIIQHDDGISKDEENGYVIAPIGSSSRLMTFYKNMDRLEPFFSMEKDLQDPPSLKFQPGISDQDNGKQEKNAFFFHQDGRMGLGKRSSPNYKLDVAGFTASQGRIGTYVSGKVPADGAWHPIITGLDNCQVFEVVARTGKKDSGRFSIMHAIATSAFGRSGLCRGKINKTCSYYGFFWNKLNLRWKSKDIHNYSLELRTNRHYGKGVDIYYNVTKLWDDKLFTPEGYYHPKKDN